MNVAELEDLVCRELREAGFAVGPSRKPADGGLSVWRDPERGGLSVWRDPERGVVVCWGSPAADGDPAGERDDTIRTAVRLALRTILGAAGFDVLDVAGRAELVVTATARPRRGGVAEPGPTTR